MNIFEKASRLKLRFPLGGNISIEQLWDVSEDNLISYEEKLIEEAEKRGKSSRRKPIKKTSIQEKEDLRSAVVSYVLDVKIAEREEATNEAEIKRHNTKIDELIAKKQEIELEDKSIEELEKMRK